MMLILHAVLVLLFAAGYNAFQLARPILRASTHLTARLPSAVLRPLLFKKKFDPQPAEINFFSVFNDQMRVEAISVPGEDGIEVLRLPEPIPMDIVDVATHSLYVRPFYSDLLYQCMKPKRVMIIGNPGTSKSLLQMVILAGGLNPNTTIDCSALRAVAEGLAGIDVIIRQKGSVGMDILFVNEREHLEVDTINPSIFKHFDHKRTLYMFEPYDTSTLGPSFTQTKTVATMSPQEVRYKEYVTQLRGTIFLYMPLYSEEQLVAIGLDMAKQPNFPEELRSFYSDAAIRDRFRKFGGVIRTVLPVSMDVEKQAKSRCYKPIFQDTARLPDGSYNFHSKVSLSSSDSDSSSEAGESSAI